MATISTKNKLLAKWPVQPFATLSHVPFFAVCGPSWDEGNVSLEQAVLPQLHIAAAQPASSINSCSCSHLPRRQKWYTGLAAAGWRWQWYRCYIWDTDWFQRQDTRPLAETPCKHPPQGSGMSFPQRRSQPTAESATGGCRHMKTTITCRFSSARLTRGHAPRHEVAQICTARRARNGWIWY